MVTSHIAGESCFESKGITITAPHVVMPKLVHYHLLRVEYDSGLCGSNRGVQ